MSPNLTNANADTDSHKHYCIVEQAIEYIRSNVEDQPSLQQIAQAVNLSEFHLQRIFANWAGISPKRFLQFITKERALAQLAQSQDLLSVAMESGLSGTGRLHDLLVTCEAMTPGEIKALGKDLMIEFGQADTPFGEALLAWTPRGLCYLEFVKQTHAQQLELLKQQWPLASFKQNVITAREFSGAIFNSSTSNKKEQSRIHLVIKGTNFQLKVWQALLNTSQDQLVSYGQLAQLAGSPKAQRAVGSALAANTIGFLIPCHRVIRGNGELGHYRWGETRKVAIQLWQAQQAETSCNIAAQVVAK